MAKKVEGSQILSPLPLTLYTPQFITFNEARIAGTETLESGLHVVNV